MAARSAEAKAVSQFVSGISTLETFHPSIFAYLFAAESTALQHRALECFLNLVEIWADRDIEDATEDQVNLTVTARRIRDGLKIYQV